jgi:hypothetical protein
VAELGVHGRRRACCLIGYTIVSRETADRHPLKSKNHPRVLLLR